MTGKVAIVGAGPSGCFVAQALLKAEPTLQVDIVDSLPVPYGLIRYGVAADHQGTKNIVRQFARIFERQGANFFGNVHIGRDVTLNALRDAYDAVVLAAGLSTDRQLSISGADLPGIYGSAEFTRSLNEHPEASALPDIGPNPVIVGNGNVAIDLLRLLCKSPDELAGTDLGPGPSAWLAETDLKSITIVGRSPAESAKFDPVMIKELAKLTNVSIKVVRASHSDKQNESPCLEALAKIDGVGDGPIAITFRFELTPKSIEGNKYVTGLQVSGCNGIETIAASSILTAIGFTSDGNLEREKLLQQTDQNEVGKLAGGLYATGWFRRGPRGTIPDNRADAQVIAKLVLKELKVDQAHVGAAIFDDLDGIVDYAGWQRIDAAELAQSSPERCRQKFTSITDLLNQAK